MARQIIDTITDHGSYKGDPAKLAFDKSNANFEELYAATLALSAVGGDNMLINCGLPINHRGFVGGALAAGAYGYDRWKAGAGGCNVSINAATGVYTHSSGPLQQVVESPQMAWGLPLTISVENPSGSIAVSVGGATGTITAGSGRRGVTLTPTGSGNMIVQLTASGVTYSRPKLERGSSATAFEPRPVGAELMLCYRFYEPLAFIATSDGAFFKNVLYKVPKRAVPALTVVAGSIAPATLNARGSTLFFTMDGGASASGQVTVVADSEL